MLASLRRIARHGAISDQVLLIVRRAHELFRPFPAIFRAFLAIVHQFESENAASRVDVDPVPVRKQTCALRADTPIDHVANDLGSAFDSA